MRIVKYATACNLKTKKEHLAANGFDLDKKRPNLVIYTTISSKNAKKIKQDEMILTDQELVLAHSKNLVGAELPQAKLNNIILKKISLDGANLQGADLRRARLNKVSLIRTNLANTNLNMAVLRECDLRLTKLDGASTQSTDFSESKLRPEQIPLETRDLVFAFPVSGKEHVAALARAILGLDLTQGQQYQFVRARPGPPAHAHFLTIELTEKGKKAKIEYIDDERVLRKYKLHFIYSLDLLSGKLKLEDESQSDFKDEAQRAKHLEKTPRALLTNILSTLTGDGPAHQVLGGLGPHVSLQERRGGEIFREKIFVRQERTLPVSLRKMLLALVAS